MDENGSGDRNGNDSLEFGRITEFWGHRLWSHLQRVGCPDHPKIGEAIEIATIWLARHAGGENGEEMFHLLAGTIHRFIPPSAIRTGDLETLFRYLEGRGVPEENLAAATTSIREVLSPPMAENGRRHTSHIR